jgi:hypothetical protein
MRQNFVLALKSQKSSGEAEQTVAVKNLNLGEKGDIF